MAINQELIDAFNQTIGRDGPDGGEGEFLEQCRRIGQFIDLHDKFKTEKIPDDWQEKIRLKSALVNLEIAVDRAYRVLKKDGPFFEDDDEENDDDYFG
jgi:hypothetical protein